MYIFNMHCIHLYSSVLLSWSLKFLSPEYSIYMQSICSDSQKTLEMEDEF